MMTTQLKTLLLAGLLGLLAVPVGADHPAPAPSPEHQVFAAAGQMPADGALLLASADQAAPPAPAAPQSPAPELVVAAPLYDFGQVLDGTEVVHDFLIANRGAGDLAISQVRTG
jgi:hypothetical protein